MNIVTNNKWIGQRTIRPDGMDKVTGRAAVRRRHHHARHDLGQGAAQPASACAHQVDRHLEGGEAAGREGRRHREGHRRFPDREGRGHARHPGHALDVPQRDGARQGAVPRPPHRRRRRDHGSDRSRSLQADRGRLRGAAVVDRDRRCDQARRADPARVQQVRRQAVQHRRPHRAQEGRHRGRLQEGRRRHRAHLHHAPRSSGLYRAACLPDLGRARRQDHDLELEPGPVHGARDDGLSHRHPAERHPRHPRRDRRRLWRQDHRLSRTARDHAGEEIRPPGEDGDDARGSDARDRPDLRLEEHGEDRRDEGRQDRRRARHLLSAGRRLPGLADPRRGRLQLHALRHPERALRRL